MWAATCCPDITWRELNSVKRKLGIEGTSYTSRSASWRGARSCPSDLRHDHLTSDPVKRGGACLTFRWQALAELALPKAGTKARWSAPVRAITFP